MPKIYDSLYVIGSGVGSILNIQTSGTDLFTVKANGVGVGTNIPTARFSVDGTGLSTYSPVFNFIDNAGGNILSADNSGSIIFGKSIYGVDPMALNNGFLGLNSFTQGPASLIGVRGATNSTRLEIRNNSQTLTELIVDYVGNVGIGLNNPSARLHINGSGTQSSSSSLVIKNSDGGSILYVKDNGEARISSNTATDEVSFEIAGNTGIALRVDSYYGRVYMGTSPPSGGQYATLTLGHYGVQNFLHFGTEGVFGSIGLYGGSGILFNGKNSYESVNEFQLNSEPGYYALNNDTTAYFRRNVAIGMNGTNASRLQVKGGTVSDIFVATDYSGNDVFKVTLNGRTAIGLTATPGEILSVEGNILTNGKLHIRGSGNDASTTSFSVDSQNNNTIYILKNDGHIGIGTASTSPNSRISLLSTSDMGISMFLTDAVLDRARIYLNSSETLAFQMVNSGFIFNTHQGVAANDILILYGSSNAKLARITMSTLGSTSTYANQYHFVSETDFYLGGDRAVFGRNISAPTSGIGSNYGGYFVSEGVPTGGTWTNVGGYFSATASGGSNYAIITEYGLNGFGITSPSASMHIMATNSASSGVAFRIDNTSTTSLNNSLFYIANDGGGGFKGSTKDIYFGDNARIQTSSGGGQGVLTQFDLYNCRALNDFDANVQNIIKVKSLGVGTYELGGGVGVISIVTTTAPTSNITGGIALYTVNGTDLTMRDENGIITRLDQSAKSLPLLDAHYDLISSSDPSPYIVEGWQLFHTVSIPTSILSSNDLLTLKFHFEAYSGTLSNVSIALFYTDGGGTFSPSVNQLIAQFSDDNWYAQQDIFPFFQKELNMRVINDNLLDVFDGGGYANPTASSLYNNGGKIFIAGFVTDNIMDNLRIRYSTLSNNRLI